MGVDNLTTVAVYGTLKSNYGNNVLLAAADHAADGTISGHRLYQSGIPYVVQDDTSPYDIQVEVYNVTDAELASLDRLEGHPEWYKREITPVLTEAGFIVQAYVYKMAEQPRGTTENTSGVF